jgi:hypothetical protein
MRATTEALWIGAALTGLSLLTWTLMITVTPPEDRRFLEWARRPYVPVRDVSGGVEFDFRVCAGCPVFVLIGRGFASPSESWAAHLVVFWHLPALIVACRPAPALHVCEPQLLLFMTLVALQWFLLAAALRGALLGYALWKRRLRGRREAQVP